MDSQEINIHQEIIDRSRDGDRIAQRELYELYGQAMFNTALRILQNREEAEDVLQEAFVTCFARLSQYRKEATFGAWLKRIVINGALNKLRKSQRIMFVEEVQDTAVEDAIETVGEYTVDAVKEAIRRLPQGFRAVLTLYLFEGYDHAEIAQILGITVSTSKSQYNRAKRKVREMIESKQSYG